jgi:hypothetical protein
MEMAVENKPSAPNRQTSSLSVIALVLAILALVLAIVLPTQIRVGPQGIQGIQGPQGPQGPKGDPGGLAWGTPTKYGSYTLDIGTGNGAQTTTDLNSGDLVQFSFTVSGSSVYYWVEDSFGNIILTGKGGNAVMLGEGHFIAAGGGTYWFSFTSTGVVTPSVLIIDYTVYPVYHR